MENTEKAEMGGKFKDWLTGSNDGAFQCEAARYYLTVIRVRKNEDFNYLYCQRQYQGSGIERGDDFKYAGIYRKQDGKLYDWQYDVRALEDGGPENGGDPQTLLSCLKMDVCRAVETAIDNDRHNLRVTEITDAHRREQLADFPKYHAASTARNQYLYSEFGDYAFTYECHYEPTKWTEDSLLAYILDPVGYAAAETAAYIGSHQEQILEDFLNGDMIAAAYAEILKNPLNPVHRVRRIMRAVKASSAKTVTVTICKNDIEFTFKAEADQFRRDCGDHYSDWHIVTADRREFERLFGHSDYGPEDILRIEYARSVLYQAVEAPV